MTRDAGIVARFHSSCPRCGRDIAPGDMVVRTSREVWIHVGCASGNDDE